MILHLLRKVVIERRGPSNQYLLKQTNKSERNLKSQIILQPSITFAVTTQFRYLQNFEK